MAEKLPIRARLAGLQVPISQIRSLALVVGQTVGDMTRPEAQEDRDVLDRATDLIDLIAVVARLLSAEAEGIERDAPRDRLAVEDR